MRTPLSPPLRSLLPFLLPVLLVPLATACNDESGDSDGGGSAGASAGAGGSAGSAGAAAGSAGSAGAGAGAGSAGTAGTTSAGAGGGGGATTVTLTPKPSYVLTCSKTTFSAPSATTWSATAGTVDATGAYTAPKQEAKGVVVTASAGASKDEATFDAVTVHPTPAKTLAPSDEAPVQVGAVVVASGDRVYQVSTAESGGASPHVQIRRSDDGGKTWGSAVRVSPPTGNTDPTARASCASMAVDPSNPDVLYVVANYASGLGVGKGLVPTLKDDDVAFVLHRSENGGKTFEHVPLQVGNSADPIPVAQGVCPTVVAPAKDAVFVATPGGANIAAPDMPYDLFTWSDANRGKGFTLQSDEYNAIANPHGSLVDPSADWAQNGGSGTVAESPAAFTDGKGGVCLTYVGFTPQGGATPMSQVRVRCTPDGGTTWSADANASGLYGFGGIDEVSKPAGAIGPSGQIAVVATVLSPKDATKAMPLALSKDGGKTFETSFVPPPPQSGDVAIVPTLATVRWDASGTLWVAYHATAGGDLDRIFVDKSCDGGTTWSGADLVNDASGGGTFSGAMPGFVATAGALSVAVSSADAAAGVRLVGLTP